MNDTHIRGGFYVFDTKMFYLRPMIAAGSSDEAKGNLDR
jgi:hypothetical protein